MRGSAARRLRGRTEGPEPLPHLGVVELKNGAVIENAWCSIYTGLREDTVTYATTGGIITADNATFRNNRQSVVINSYAGIAPSGTIADPYSLTETRFCEGYAEPFAENAEDAEMANYAEFHTMKLVLRNQNDNMDNQNNDHSSNSSNSPINMQNVPAGMYVLRVTSADGHEYHQKIVKK